LFGVTLDWRVFAANRVQYKAKQAAMDRNATSASSWARWSSSLQLQSQTASNNLEICGSPSISASTSQTALYRNSIIEDQQKLYREGQLLYIELLDAQNRLISDQLQQSISYLNVQTRTAELERAKASYVFSN
jgi:hypothetical protein